MATIKCAQCGAPLKITPRDISLGSVTCAYCGTSSETPKQEAPVDADMVAGLKLLTKFQRLFGLNTEELDGPAERPDGTKIELRNEPGVFFQATLPPPGISFRTVPIAFFTVIWCGFMVVWNVIGIASGQWAMVAFGGLHDAVAVFLLLTTFWGWFGREEIVAQSGQITSTRSLFGIKRVHTYEWSKISNFIFKESSRSKNRAYPGMFMVVDHRPKRIAGNAQVDELRWLRTELLKFFEPVWKQ